MITIEHFEDRPFKIYIIRSGNRYITDAIREILAEYNEHVDVLFFSGEERHIDMTITSFKKRTLRKIIKKLHQLKKDEMVHPDLLWFTEEIAEVNDNEWDAVKNQRVLQGV